MYLWVPIPAGESTELDPVALSERLGRPSFTQQRAIDRGIPTGEANEVIPTGDAYELEVIPTGDASELDSLPLPAIKASNIGNIPVGEASELDAGMAPRRPGDLVTADGMPYGSKTAANLRAKREGMPLSQVIKIPGAGWVVRPVIEARPNNTRGTNARDLPGVRNVDQPDVSGTPRQPAADGAGRLLEAGDPGAPRH
jgi:hypothetical protein